MIVLQCAKCGTQYDGKLEESWGRTQETNGYGSSPRCVALVPNRFAPKAPDGSEPLQVCGGQLAAIDAAEPRLAQLTPNA